MLGGLGALGHIASQVRTNPRWWAENITDLKAMDAKRMTAAASLRERVRKAAASPDPYADLWTNPAFTNKRHGHREWILDANRIFDEVPTTRSQFSAKWVAIARARRVLEPVASKDIGLHAPAAVLLVSWLYGFSPGPYSDMFWIALVGAGAYYVFRAALRSNTEHAIVPP